ncbi:hypothetical protein FB567DRAFT_63677 [Paraphoma chrysanthemicola]|uniref:Uncharacterized protein n=1 Tax=Paraphoma chrysanthemicola TaxID=798071 RepID=A0A8K0R2F7_9PLEO|nr:hypothetical protein FB567DRAFT_63677 [Paraphoma chrysanthemicola]
MGITISHTNYAPISLVSTLIGFVSFAFTLGTFLKVFWSNLGTFSAAPSEINDYLSSLKQGLLEQRRHLRRSRRRLKNIRRDRSHGPGAKSVSDDDDYERGYSTPSGKRRSRDARPRRKRGQMHFDRDIQSMRSSGEDEALRVMRVTVRDLIKSFRALEQPFLKPEFQTQDSAHWSTNSTHQQYYPEKPSPNYPDDEDDSPHAAHMQSTDRMGHEYKNCGFKERWLWVRRKAEVKNLSEVLSRVETRRTAHEVGEVLGMVCDIGRDVQDLRGSLDGVEGRLSRVVGVRRVQ